MNARTRASNTTAVAGLLVVGLLALSSASGFAQEREWRRTFNVPLARLGPTGDNPYLPLRPGTRMVYRGGATTVTTSVLADTAMLNHVHTRVVEEREERRGKLVELTHDYYAIDDQTNDVYYFGERVENYQGDKVVSHEGTWLTGVNGADFGLALPAHPAEGDRYYEELAPGRAMDRAEVVGVDESVDTPVGRFEHCVHLRETSALEPGEVSQKWFAPGVGLVKDDDVALVKIERPGA